MFRKILIAEDFDTYNVAIAEALKTLPDTETSHVSYCDDALLRIRAGVQQDMPYDLLISDLSFKPDHKKAAIDTGIALIAEAKKISPELRVVVYSIENRIHPVRQLFDVHGIDGYVLKGRNNIPELRRAILCAYKGERYISDEITQLMHDRSLDEVDDYDVVLLRLLADGIGQGDIPAILDERQISPSSKSSVEKRLNRLRTILGANNNVQLAVIAKDFGLL
jgi:DNA-binding NarL/FixJ family response regulator